MHTVQILINGRSYGAVVGSDLERDGMFLELGIESGAGWQAVAECFYSDVDGSFAITAYEANVDPAALAWLREEGARRLLPARGTV
jgi:hypothetical protein